MVGTSWLTVLFTCSTSFLISCVLVLLTVEMWVLKSLALLADLSVSSYSSITFCSMYLETRHTNI